MKKIGISLMFTVLLLLSACSESEITPQINEEVDGGGEETTINEISNRLTNEEDDEIEAEEVEEEAEEEPEIEVVEDEQEESTDEVLPGAEEILEKSFDAMSELTGVYMESVLDVREVMGETTVEEVRRFNTVMLLTEPFSQRLRVTIDVFDDINGDEYITSEVYKVDGKHYIYRSFDDSWIWIDDPAGERQLSPLITDDTLENHLMYSDQFEVSETEDEYLLTFSGTYDEFISSMFGGAQEMLMEIERQNPPNLNDVINSFSILIEKDGFHVRKYNIYHEQTAPDDFGDYFVSKDGYVLLGNYNQYDEDSVKVTDNILNEVVPGGE